MIIFRRKCFVNSWCLGNDLRLLLPLKHGGLIYVSVKQQLLLCYIANHTNWLNAT